MVSVAPVHDVLQDPADIIIGRKRPEDNPLVVRYEVGRSRCTGTAPQGIDPEFTYGMPSKRDPESAGEVVLTWVEHTKSKYQKELGAKDFVRMNKQSIGNACVTSKEVTGYRKEHDMRVPKTKNRKPPKNEIPTSVEERTFGSRSKADTGVNDLITNRFALEWVTEQQQLMVVRSTEGKPAKSQRQKRQYIHPVRSPVEETPKASYTLNKYRGVPARTLTTRTPVPTASARVKLPPISHTPEPVSS